MNETLFIIPTRQAVAMQPSTYTVRPLTPEELREAGGGVLMALLLPAVQKVR